MEMWQWWAIDLYPLPYMYIYAYIKHIYGRYYQHKGTYQPTRRFVPFRTRPVTALRDSRKETNHQKDHVDYGFYYRRN